MIIVIGKEENKDEQYKGLELFRRNDVLLWQMHEAFFHSEGRNTSKAQRVIPQGQDCNRHTANVRCWLVFVWRCRAVRIFVSYGSDWHIIRDTTVKDRYP